jgi:hypothetical protein
MSDLLVANIDKTMLKELIAKGHYSHRCSAITVGYGVWYKGVLSGGIVFSAGVGRSANAYCRVCKPTEMIELTRLWLNDRVPKNAESQVIAVALRTLKKGRGRFRAVLSYADEQAGHIGTIYQATNFYYMGASSPNSETIIDGTRVSQRSLSSRYGTNKIGRLKKILGTEDVKRTATDKVKHAYVYPLEPEALEYCKAHCRPYPKKRAITAVEA